MAKQATLKGSRETMEGQRGPVSALEDTFSNGVEIMGRSVFSTDFHSPVKEKSKHAHLETKKLRLREILNLRRMLA